MTPLTKFITDVKSRLKKATPGPWRKGQWSDGSQGPNEWNVFADVSEITPVVGTVEADAEFIANAPTDLARAIRVIEVQAKALKEYRREDHESGCESGHADQAMEKVDAILEGR